MRNKKKIFFQYIKKILSGMDLFKRIILNLLFWGIFILIISSFIQPGVKITGSQNALTLNIHGDIVEEFSSSSLTRTVRTYNGMDMSETLLWDLVSSIELAESDKNINSIFIDFRLMGGAGLGALTEIRRSLEKFKESGKTVIAYSDSYNQGQYYLASVADKIFVDPMGDFLITGFSVYNQYYGEGLERLGVDINYFHAGKYKSAGEVYTRSSMSDEEKEQNLEWSGDLWSHYVSEVSASRGIEKKQFNMFINNYIELLYQADGSSVKTALDAGMVDGLMDRREIRSYMMDISGYSVDSDTFNRIAFEDYLNIKQKLKYTGNEKIAVITSRGTIYNGWQSPGNIGCDTLVELIDKVQLDSSCKALVLRVDSGGGSAFASEIIRRKLQLLRASGIPVVISMGSVSASGGYWIATASDEIWAQPTTLTGSIGVFSLISTFEDPLNKYLGVNVDGVGTTWLAGSMRSDRKLDKEVGKIFQSSVNNVYNKFLTLVGESRGLPVEAVDEIAQGRVWSGSDAKELGLVDELGGLMDAIESAAKLAGLGDGNYSTVLIQQDIPISDQILRTVLNSSVKLGIFDSFEFFSKIAGNQAILKLDDLEQLNDPSSVYALSTVIFE